MERLTQKSINYCAEICRAQDCETYHGVRNDVCGDAAIYNRLAAYEDTGLEPEQVKAFVSTADNIVNLDVNKLYPDAKITMYGKPLSHWQELSKAEQDGRLVVLPCKVGDLVYKPLGKNEEVLPIKIQWFETNNYGWCACGTYQPRATYALRFADLGKTWFTDRAEAEKAMEVSEDA